MKVPEKMDFLELSEAYNNPSFLISDFAKMENPAQLHLLFKALSEFEMHHNRFPEPWDEEDAETFIECCKSANSELSETEAHVEQIDEGLAKIFSFICAGNFCPVQVKRSFSYARSLLVRYRWHRCPRGDESLHWPLQTHKTVVLLRCG